MIQATVPQTDRAERTRTSISAAARRCFAERGYAKTSMDWIAAEAGVTKPTVYAHFGTKAGLFEHLIRSELESYNDHPIRRVTSSAAMARALCDMSRAHLDWLLAEPRIGLLRAAATETMQRPDWAQGLITDLDTSSLALWFEELTHAGLLDVPVPEDAARLHLATLKGALFYPALLGLIPIADPAERDRVARAGTDMFLALHMPTPPNF